MGRRHFRADGGCRTDRRTGRAVLRERFADRRDDAQHHDDEQRTRERGGAAQPVAREPVPVELAGGVAELSRKSEEQPLAVRLHDVGDRKRELDD